MCPSPSVLAQQLTHIELERLSSIGPEEFVQAFAKENPHVEVNKKSNKSFTTPSMTTFSRNEMLNINCIVFCRRRFET